MTLKADDVARVFNDNCPAHWKARVYTKPRANGVFNACSFSYKGGMVSFLMDCDKPVGQGFQIKFHNFMGSFGDFAIAIQKGLYQIMTRLRDADIAPNVPAIFSPTDIWFGLRKDGAVVYLCVVQIGGVAVLSDGFNDDEAIEPENEKIDTADDLI